MISSRSLETSTSIGNKLSLAVLCFFLLPLAITAQSFQSAIDQAKKRPASDAIITLDSLIAEAESKGWRDTVALLHHTKGVKWYREDLEQAITSTLKAVQVRQQIKDTAGLVQSHYNVARFFKMQGEHFEAVQHFEQIVNLGSGPNNKQFVNACIYLGQLERDRGDYQRALRFLSFGEATLTNNRKKLNWRDSLALANILQATATVYNEMRDQESAAQATETLEKAVPLFTALADQKGLAACYEEWGNALVLKEEYPQAILFFEKARTIHTRLDDPSRIAKLGNNLSIAYKRQGKYAEAETSLTKSLQLLEEIHGSSPNPEKASKYDNLAEIYLAQNQYRRALEYFQKAITNQLSSFKSKHIEDLPSREMIRNHPNKEDLLVYLGDKTRAWQAFYQNSKQKAHLNQALQTLLLSDYLIDLMRSEHLERRSRLFWREKVHGIYESAINICYLLQDYEKAFYFLEKSKSILLLEAMVNADARKVIPDSLAAREKTLQRQLLDLNRQLEQKPDDQQLRQAILVSQQANREFINQLKTTFPRYHEIRYEHDVTKLSNLQAFLKNEQHLLIHFFYGQDYVFIMPIHVDQVALVRLEKSDTLEQSITSFIALFESASTILNEPQTYAQLAYQVYKRLFQPVLPQSEPQAIKKITLIMDGQLNYLPTEALLYKQPEDQALALLPYLNTRYEVGYAYSATILLRQLAAENRVVATKAKVLGLAPFVGKTTNPKLPELVYSKAELRGIRKQVEGQFLMGEEASRQVFLEQSPQFNVVHLSTHASAYNSTSTPYIAFADQPLSLPELYATEMSANLVVLSACETGLGTVQQGEGVMSLARGFTYAGATSLISSLWRVNDQATASLFTTFYDQLVEGKPKNKALHAAKLAYLQNPAVTDAEKSPYYWAGFVFIGADGALPVRAPVGLWRWGLALFGVVLGIVFIFRIQKGFRSSRR